MVDQAVPLGLERRHVPVAVGVEVDLPRGLARAGRHDPVEVGLVEHDFLRLDLDVDRLARGPAQGLVDHDPRVGHRVALSRGPRAQQEGAHRRREAEAVGRDVGARHLHRVVDAEAGGDRPPGELMKSLMSCFVFFFVVVLVEVVVIGEREVGGGSECLKKKKERQKRGGGRGRGRKKDDDDEEERKKNSLILSPSSLSIPSSSSQTCSLSLFLPFSRPWRRGAGAAR